MPSPDIYPSTEFDTVTVYDLDSAQPKRNRRDEELAAFTGGAVTPNIRKVKGDIFRGLFTKSSNYVVKIVDKSKASTPRKFQEYWEDESKGKTGKDLDVVYYNNKAWGSNEEYYW
jgi:hypothetical protein